MAIKKKQKRAVKSSGNGINREALLATSYTSPTQFAPRTYVINDEPTKLIQPWERRQQIQLARELFAKMPIVSAAIGNKNHIAVGNAWQPHFKGDIQTPADKAWVDAATKWLTNDYYPNLNWNGSNFGMTDTLYMSGKDIDMDGGSMMIYRKTKAGLPRIQLVPTDRVACRQGEETVADGQYAGYRIYDGIVYNEDNMPVAYKILGSKPEDDQIISAFSCQYLFEPGWTSAGHGVSRISYSVTNLMDIQDINEYLKITVKNFAAQGIIHKNPKGAAPKGKRMFSVKVPAPAATQAVSSEPQSKIYFETINKGGTQYISSLDGSDILPFSFDRPSPNTEAFIFRISSEAISSIGWFLELVFPQKLNGTSVRLIQDQARKLIVWRQQTLERRAKAIVQYGLAQAMQLGLIPKTDNKTWLNWGFNKPAELTIDTGYDAQAQIEALKMGLTTKSEICSKRGKNWMDVQKQSDIELRDLFTRAQALAKDFNISEAEAREWLSKRDIDVIQPQPSKVQEEEETETDNDGDTGNPANN